MKTRMIFGTAALLAMMAGGAIFVFAHGSGTPVGPITGTVSQVNYNEHGTIDGFVVGTSLLSFPKVCGGLGSLNVTGSVTYSGNSRKDSDAPLSIVSVNSFAPSSGPYTVATSTTATIDSTAGTLGNLNYDSDGEPNGFLWTSSAPVTNPATVLVITGTKALEKTAPTAITSVKFSQRTSSCSPTAPAFVVEALSLNGTATKFRLDHDFSHDNDD